LSKLNDGNESSFATTIINYTIQITVNLP
jgi:hypothetical protein